MLGGIFLVLCSRKGSFLGRMGKAGVGFIFRYIALVMGVIKIIINQFMYFFILFLSMRY